MKVGGVKMSRTNDSLFHKEFRDMMNGRRSISKNFNLVDLPLPELTTMINGFPKLHMALVKNIKEPFFDRLNNQEVQLVGRTTLQKRQVLSDGTFRKNAQGKFEYTQIPVPHGHVAILTSLSIGLKRKIMVNGVERPHKVTDGYRYIDYVQTKLGRKYIYIIPKSFVYRLSMCALVLTPNKRRNYFQGCKLALQNGNYVYLYVVPYKYRENLDLRVLGVKSSFDFNEEVSQIITYWMGLGVIFNLTVTTLEGQVNGVTNLGIMDLEGTVVSEDYTRIGASLADENEEEFNASMGVED
jgi:hypothetical protein